MPGAAIAGPARPGGRVRRLPVGAEPGAGGVHFRVWAPAVPGVAVLVEDGGEHRLEAEPDGYFSGLVVGLGHGARYRYRLGDGAARPDPAARFQPEGALGPSMVVDPGRYAWHDAAWPGVPRSGQVIYELHAGTFTQEGTWQAAIGRLPRLAEVGITLLELMPVNQYPGTFGWGYDGVDLFAPNHRYGTPDDLRRFVDAAHGHGLGVILDVVYNHLGPVGNYLKEFSPAYFSARYVTDWGEPLNFDGAQSGPVRELVLANGRYWIEEFHLDGFRIDATQSIYDFPQDGDEDGGHEHILAAFTAMARAAAHPRAIFIVGENEPQDTRLIRPPETGGFGLDALWNDDFHHSAMVALTGRNEAYLTDYQGRPQELVAAVRHGFLYQGQRYRWQDQPRGTPTRGFLPEQFVTFIQNHDQLANMGRGLRVHQVTGPGRYRAMTALLLLGPGTPMLFQGQEFAASTPFHYFAGFEGDLARAVERGRRHEAAQFLSLATAEMQAVLPRPDDLETYQACKLDWSEFDRHREAVALHKDLLRLRREDATLVAARRPGGIDGVVIGPEAFVLRYLGQADGGAVGDDRLLLVNLGIDLELTIMPEPLLAPPEGHDWELLWSSEHPAYGGAGSQAPSPDRAWVVPGNAALLLRPGPPSPHRKGEREKVLAQAAGARARATGTGNDG